MYFEYLILFSFVLDLFSLFSLIVPFLAPFFFFGQSTASIVPQLWQPTNGALMSNDLSETKSAEESAACIALSKNDSYVMSASGGKISLFNMMTFKVVLFPVLCLFYRPRSYTPHPIL